MLTSQPLPIINSIARDPSEPSSGKPQHVVLIRPARLSSGGTWSSPFTPPLGLAYLASTLRESGFRVSAIDAIAEEVDQFVMQDGFRYQGLTLEQIIDRIDSEATVVGVSCMFSQDWPYCRDLLYAIRERLPHALIVAGGEHITAMSELSLRQCSALDVIVQGEGEETLVEVVSRYSRGEEIAGTPGTVCLRDDQIIRGPGRNRIRDVDQIPRPAWDLFPVEVYLSSNNMFGVNRGRSIAVLATRGCPYKCTFCSNPGMYGKLWAARSPKLLLDEIEDYIHRYNVQNFDFYDLTMVLKKDWILEFCRLIEERGLKFTWQLPSGTRSEIVDEEVAAALYRTGCRNLAFAPESGSPRVLKLIKKQVDLDKMLHAMRVSLANKLRVKNNIIIGFPEDKRSDILKTVLFCWKTAVMGADAAEVMVFSPYPGTELFDDLVADGTLKNFDDDYFRSLAAFLDPTLQSKFCKSLSGRELTFWRVFIMSTFFAISFALRPWRFARLVVNVIRDRSETVLEHRLGVMLRRPAAIKAEPRQVPASA